MYELIILGQLMHGSGYGYMITKIINDMIGPYARISPGRLYPLLTKLEQDGLIEVDQEAQQGRQSDRKSRVYKITEAGRLRFYYLMRDTSSNPGDYQRVFALKVCGFHFITPAERLRLLDHYINYCEAHVLHQQAEAEDLVHDTSQNYPGYPHIAAESVGYAVEMIHHSVKQWQLELAWARSLRDKELARSGQTPQVSTT